MAMKERMQMEFITEKAFQKSAYEKGHKKTQITDVEKDYLKNLTD